MGLSYNDLYSKKKSATILRENLYKEKTNVLSYYVIKTILLNNYQGFLSWCKTNNFSLLQFKKTLSNQKEYCNFIRKNYKTTSFLTGVNDTEEFFENIQKNIQKNNKNTPNQISNKNLKYILTNLRMSICELG
jgi:hypothetical protein